MRMQSGDVILALSAPGSAYQLADQSSHVLTSCSNAQAQRLPWRIARRLGHNTSLDASMQHLIVHDRDKHTTTSGAFVSIIDKLSTTLAT